jgi:hypothetical protein
MSFYSPNMQHPDYAGGLQDMVYQIIQMMMLKKMMSQTGQGQQPPQQPYLPGGQLPGLQGSMTPQMPNMGTQPYQQQNLSFQDWWPYLSMMFRGQQ